MLPGLTYKKLNSKNIAILLNEFDHELEQPFKYTNSEFPNSCQKIISNLHKKSIISDYPTTLIIEKNDRHTKTLDYDKTNKYKYGQCVIFIVLHEAAIKFVKDDYKSVKLELKPGSILILTESVRYDWKYKFSSTISFVLFKFTQLIPDPKQLCSTNVRAERLVQYTRTLHPADSSTFILKLSSMSEKARITYLDDFLDTNLEEFGDQIYEDKSDSRKSIHDHLYEARDDDDHSDRILLWRATLNKLSDGEIRHQVYEKCFGLDLSELKILHVQSEISELRQIIYTGFLSYINLLRKKKFEQFVEKIFDKDTTALDIFF